MPESIPQTKPWSNLLIHFSLSLVLLYILSLISEFFLPNSVKVYIDPEWLLWVAAGSIIVFLLIRISKRK